MVSRASSIWWTFAAVQASSVSCTTDCSAQRARPIATCNPRSLRSRVLISTSPWAPARMVMKASWSFCTGVSLITFCSILTNSSIGPNSWRLRSLTPNAANPARGEKWRDPRRVVDLLIERDLLSQARPSLHLFRYGPSRFSGQPPPASTLPLLRAKLRY